MKSTTKLLLLVCLIALIICMVAAQEDTTNNGGDNEELNFDDDEEVSYDDISGGEEQYYDGAREDQNLGRSYESPDVEVSYVLPENANKKFSVGKKSKILLGFTNTGLNPFTVYGIRGYISHPQDASFVVQNFTAIRYNTTIQPEETNSLAYEFFPDSRLETVSFGVTFQVFYINEDNDTFVHHFFNETVTFVENDEVFDVQQYYLYATLLAVFGGLAYYAYVNYLGGNKAVKSISSSSSGAAPKDSANTPSSPTSDKSNTEDEVDFSFVNPRHLNMLKNQKKRR